MQTKQRMALFPPLLWVIDTGALHLAVQRVTSPHLTVYLKAGSLGSDRSRSRVGPGVCVS